MMCSDQEILQKFGIVEAYMKEEHPQFPVERVKGAHELKIIAPPPAAGVGIYQEYRGLASSLKNHFSCINIEETPFEIKVTI